MTATPSTPIEAAWAARATVSAVDWAPQWTISVPSQASRNAEAARIRSSSESSTPSPVVPSAKSPSTPPAARKSTIGPIASSSSAAPPLRSGVTDAARSRAIAGDPTRPGRPGAARSARPEADDLAQGVNLGVRRLAPVGRPGRAVVGEARHRPAHVLVRLHRLELLLVFPPEDTREPHTTHLCTPRRTKPASTVRPARTVSTPRKGEIHEERRVV